MRQNFRFPFVLLSVFSLLSIDSMLIAQQGKKPTTPASNSNPPAGKPANGRPSPVKTAATEPPAGQGLEKKQRPTVVETEELDIDPISPELERILVKWETESAKIKSLHGKHTRSEFNKTFAVEKVSEGEFFLETPDKGRIDMLAKAPKKGEVSSRKDAEGKPYALEKGSSERWICTGEEIFSFDEKAKTYTRDELPENLRGKNIVHSPLPFLFGMKAEEAKSRFNMVLVSEDKEAKTAKLKATPRLDSDRQNYREAWIILDIKRFVPTAVRLIDPNVLETIYMFKDIVINDGNFVQQISARWRGNPYKPDLTGYKRYIPNEVEPAGARVRGGANQAQQAGGPVGGAGGAKNDAEMAPNGRNQPPARTSSGSQPGRK